MVDATARAAHFRAKAEQLRARAAAIRSGQLRDTLIERAVQYDALSVNAEKIAKARAEADSLKHRKP